MSSPALLLGSAVEEVRVLSSALPATLVAVPDPAPGDAGLDWTWSDELDRWGGAEAAGEPAERVVVAPWVGAGAVARAGLADTPLDDWVARCERPLARWWAAFGVAARRCADGGAIVAVIERPPPLHAAGWCPAAAVADAAEMMARSLARSEGGRGVRVNAVTTPVRLHRRQPGTPTPLLATFLGRVDAEVVGAVRLLLGPDGAGITGTVVHADGGQSW